MVKIAGLEHHESKSIRHLPDQVLWQMRNHARKALVDFARERLTRTLEASGADTEGAALVKHLFDPNILTLGFARRFATYKRPNLLLYDPDRLLRLLKNTKTPIQLVIAGKAHPADKAGQALIQQWIRFIRRPDVRSHVIFIEDYDMQVTEQLIRGVDVWVNTPRRPWEACGTSGMKVLSNGGLNLSVLDGWWAEAYAPEIGWALGDGQEHGDDSRVDAADANQLYELLENTIIPEFYQRSEDGIPKAWVAKMRESMARLSPQFSADRAVREYTEQYYLPAARAYRERASEHGALGKRLFNDVQMMAEKWHGLRFGDIHSRVDDTSIEYDVQIYLNGIQPEEVKVELFAEGRNGNAPVEKEMACVAGMTTADGLYLYSTTISKDRPIEDYTARVVPSIPEVKVPLEECDILWQR